MSRSVVSQDHVSGARTCYGLVQYSRSSVRSASGGPSCDAGLSMPVPGVAGGGRWLGCTGGLRLPPAKGAVAGRGQGRVERCAPPAIGQERPVAPETRDRYPALRAIGSTKTFDKTCYRHVSLGSGHRYAGVTPALRDG